MSTLSLDIAITIGMAIFAIGLVVAFFVPFIHHPFIHHWAMLDRPTLFKDWVRTLGDQVNDELWGHLIRKYWHEQVEEPAEPLSEPPRRTHRKPDQFACRTIFLYFFQ